MSLCECLCALTRACMYLWGSEVSVFLSHYPPDFLRLGLSLSLQLTKSTKLAGQQVSGILQCAAPH